MTELQNNLDPAVFEENSLRPLLEAIRVHASNNLTALEASRLLRDLSRTLFRLEKREYAKASFDDNLLDLQGRLKQLSREIDFYRSCARLWQQVLGGFDLPLRVVDLCPGVAPKIELALHYLGYRGVVQVIDKDPNSAEEIRRFMELFDAPIEIEGKTADVFSDDCGAHLFVTASHIVDDLIMDLQSASPAELYEKEDKFRAFWSDVLANRRTVQPAAVEMIASLFGRLIAPAGRLVVVQYPSYAERTLGLEKVHQFCLEILDEVVLRSKHHFSVSKPVVKAADHFSQWQFFVFSASG